VWYEPWLSEIRLPDQLTCLHGKFSDCLTNYVTVGLTISRHNCPTNFSSWNTCWATALRGLHANCIVAVYINSELCELKCVDNVSESPGSVRQLNESMFGRNTLITFQSWLQTYVELLICCLSYHHFSLQRRYALIHIWNKRQNKRF